MDLIRRRLRKKSFLVGELNSSMPAIDADIQVRHGSRQHRSNSELSQFALFVRRERSDAADLDSD